MRTAIDPANAPGTISIFEDSAGIPCNVGEHLKTRRPFAVGKPRCDFGFSR